MLTCKEITERVTGYMERHLSWSEWLQFKLHVSMCRFCRRYVSQMQVTKAALRRLGQQVRRSTSVDAGMRDVFRAWKDESRLS